MKWIRVEAHSRHHAVLATTSGQYVTWCGRWCDLGVPVTNAPAMRCNACQSRMRHPYLLPVELAELRRGEEEEKAMGGGA